jgi:hypothetical protein
MIIDFSALFILKLELMLSAITTTTTTAEKEGEEKSQFLFKTKLERVRPINPLHK